ncbi:helix-turn-helix domain-containing protein [Mogibacterium sp.]|uniref:helix-turn-helix domain-containing protein n=1 Tax=Mogibacterium sp. TaxID=2049035 RepID=UPI0025804A46|nr:helix-turn-helix domain-containing protein [Mogibacterium sp.]
MDNKQLYTEIGLKIRSFRKSRGMTLIELAQLINKSVPTVSKYEHGEVSIGIDILMDICRIFDVDIDIFLPCTSTHPENADIVRYEKFFEDILYIYWYNGEHNRIRSALIDNRSASRTKSILYYDIESTKNIDNSTFIYLGTMNYSDTGSVFVYTNSLPPFDKMTIRIPSFTRAQNYRFGLMTTLSYFYQNVATKIIAASKPLSEADKKALLPQLKISAEEIKEIKRTNFFIV